MQKWTQEEAIAFECAREVISDWMAIKTGEIYAESEKEVPDQKLIEDLRKERSKLFEERAKLRLKDHTTIQRVRNQYGVLVRAWRMENYNTQSSGA